MIRRALAWTMGAMVCVKLFGCVLNWVMKCISGGGAADAAADTADDAVAASNVITGAEAE